MVGWSTLVCSITPRKEPCHGSGAGHLQHWYLVRSLFRAICMVEAVRIRDRHSTITYTKESKLCVCVDDNVEPLTNTTQREWVGVYSTAVVYSSRGSWSWGESLLFVAVEEACRAHSSMRHGITEHKPLTFLR